MADFPSFEASVAALLTEYQSGDSDRRKQAHSALIAGKRTARLGASRCGDARRKAELLEFAEWILIALENTSVFPEWSSLRKRSPGFAALFAERSGASVRHTTDASREL